MEVAWSFLILFSVMFMASAVVKANIGDFDDHWKQRAEAAKARAQAAYVPFPEEITTDFNADVQLALVVSSNNTRRSLRARQHNERCVATNPIDRCWRCRADWASDRKRLARCAKGFGRNARGGVDGEIYIVTNPIDDDLVNPKPGTLRYGVIQDKPLWIIFAGNMNIRLAEELMINSNKTIDARGVDVHIQGGAGLTIQFVHNVIVHGLHIHDIKKGKGGMIRDSMSHYGFRTESDGDGISIYGSTDVWIDHVSMSTCTDGLIDVIEGSTAITISNGHFTSHNDVMLFGASDAHEQDKVMQITVAFNHFGNGLVQRMPRCRFGFFHVVNNDYTHWLMYAIGGSSNPVIISQGNRFTAPKNPAAWEITHREKASEDEWKNWTWISQGDLMRGGAFFRASGSTDSQQYKDRYSRLDMIKYKPAMFVNRLTRYSGSPNCKVGEKC